MSIDKAVWTQILTHEAGHAVAVYCLWDATANISIRHNADGKLKASYQIEKILNDNFYKVPQETWICLSAGFLAEKLFCSINESVGAKGDKNKMEFLRGGYGNEEPGKWMDEDKTDAYKAATDLLMKRQRCVMKIAEAALEHMESLDLANTLGDGVIVLSSHEVHQCLVACEESPICPDSENN